MIYNIRNGTVKMVEYGWIELEVDHEGETHTFEFETAEIPEGINGAKFINVEFANHDSEEKANEIGLVINDEFCSDLFELWDNYSNKNFRN
jgi:hypothetical protein